MELVIIVRPLSWRFYFIFFFFFFITFPLFPAFFILSVYYEQVSHYLYEFHCDMFNGPLFR